MDVIIASNFCVAIFTGMVQARLVLCHVTRRVSEERIVSLASTIGLTLEVERQLDGPIRVLVFKWQMTEQRV